MNRDLDLLGRTIARIGPLDERAMAAARQRQASLTKPAGSLGRLEELAIWAAGVIGDPLPSVERKVIVTAAADHGVAAEGVSAYPQEVTAQMVANFLRGGAAINVVARHVGACVVVVDAGVAAELPAHVNLVSTKMGRGTKNMARGPAMSREQTAASLAAGIELAEAECAGGAQALALGDMGIANTTTAAAVVAAVTGSPTAAVAGRGSGLDDRALAHKVEVIERALAVNRPDPAHPLDVLAKVGGFEFGLLAGVTLGAAAARRPVALDGFPTTAAALIACGLAPAARDYLLASHLSQEPGHRVVLNHLGLRPLLDLGLRLGEGTGAALGLWLLDAAVRLLRDMATFDQAGVSRGHRQVAPQG